MILEKIMTNFLRPSAVAGCLALGVAHMSAAAAGSSTGEVLASSSDSFLTPATLSSAVLGNAIRAPGLTAALGAFLAVRHPQIQASNPQLSSAGAMAIALNEWAATLDAEREQLAKPQNLTRSAGDEPLAARQTPSGRALPEKRDRTGLD